MYGGDAGIEGIEIEGDLSDDLVDDGDCVW